MEKKRKERGFDEKMKNRINTQTCNLGNKKKARK